MTAEQIAAIKTLVAAGLPIESGVVSDLLAELERVSGELKSTTEAADVWKFLAIGRRIIDAGDSIDAAVREFMRRVDAVPSDVSRN